MTERKLPVRQLVILSICRFAEPIALTSVFPYLPEMVESFGVPENDVARWAGSVSGIFSVSQALTGLIWGAASDKYGRKPIILVGLFNTMWAMLLFGVSTSLPWAMAARVLQGLGNGNVGILRTSVAELCPWKELQPRAFSVMPMVYTVGAIVGPSLGGALSNPLRVDPRKPRGDRFLERFPYILPNIAAAVFFAIGITVGWLFLKESLESKKHQEDLGLKTGAKITALFRRLPFLTKKDESAHNESQALLGQRKALNDEAERTLGVASEILKEDSPKIRDVLTYQTTLNLIVYTLLAFYALAYDQLLPVFMHHPRQLVDDPNLTLPLKFAGGFGLDSGRIGVIFTVFAAWSTFLQFLLFPPIARYLGILRCLRIAFAIFPVVFFVTPFVSLIRDSTTQQVAMLALLMVRGIGGTFAFPTSTIMITNSASSLRVLGTVNGVATSVAAIGHAAGPAVGGALFSWGVKRGYVIVPFWIMSAVALVACIPTFWLVEGKGFGDDSDSDEEGIEPIEDHDEEGRTGFYSVGVDDAAQSESDFGEPANLLSHTSTRSSLAMFSGDETEDDEEGHDRQRRSSSVLRSARSHSQGRRRRNVVRKQSSVPIGMGVGFRRFSSNLGSTGVGAGGTSWGGT